MGGRWDRTLARVGEWRGDELWDWGFEPRERNMMLSIKLVLVHSDAWTGKLAMVLVQRKDLRTG